MHRVARRLFTLTSVGSLVLCAVWALLLIEFLGKYGYVFVPVLACLAVAPLYWLVDGFLSHRFDSRARCGLCTSCGYDLRASSGRCPECGAGR